MYSPHRGHRIATLLAGREKGRGRPEDRPLVYPLPLDGVQLSGNRTLIPPSERSRIEYSGTPSSELPWLSASQSCVGSTLGLGVRSSFRKSFLLPVFSQAGIPLNYQSFLQVVLVPPGADRRPTDSSHRTLRLLCSTSRHIQPCSLVHRSFQVA